MPPPWRKPMSTISPTSPATNNACTTPRAGRGVIASTPSSTAGGTSSRPRAKRTTSQLVESRAAKNSPLRPSRSNSGSAIAKDDSTRRWRAANRNGGASILGTIRASARRNTQAGRATTPELVRLQRAGPGGPRGAGPRRALLERGRASRATGRGQRPPAQDRAVAYGNSDAKALAGLTAPTNPSAPAVAERLASLTTSPVCGASMI